MRIAEEIARRTGTQHYRLVLNEQRQPEMTGSKIGGDPYWPADRPFPVDSQGNKLSLLMQINCGDAGLQAPLPDHGILQWFISLDSELMYGCRGNYDEEGNGFRVVYHEMIQDAVTQAQGTVDRDLTPVKREVAIDVVQEQTVMGVNDGHFNQIFFDIVKEITGVEHAGKEWYDYLDNDDCLYFERQLGMKRPCHQMLGYPAYTQGEARRDIDRHDTLLFQLDSQFSTLDRNQALVMWGDMGSGFVFINRDDLAALDFGHTYYCWDCG
ncbi:MAG: DUF1963 domain-containing protein [Muribaculaceae bacterium]|nr:DUF1963 domain-containing protein [Muribaculaceae bacterium]